MAIRGKGAQPTDARTWVQAAAWALVCAALPLLSGCSSVPDAINPVSWWHGLEGGEIAKQRPPPPGQDEAYPNLATVPAKPAAPDQKQLEAITQSLVADRAHAEYLASAAPIPDPSSPAASPALFGQGTLPPLPPPGAPAASATLPAAAGPAPAATRPAANQAGEAAPPPRPAPRGGVQSAPLGPLAAAAPQANPAAPPSTGPAATAGPPAPPSPNGTAPGASGSAPATTASAQGSAATRMAAAAASMPSASAASQAAAAAAPVPATPPAPPKLSGPGTPPTAPMTVASASPAAAMPHPGNAVTVEFVPGSAQLPPGAADVLKGVAAKRGAAVIAVTGYGEARSDDPAVQSAALSLGLSRAQAVANALTTDGVPASAVRVGAEAAGRGASVRLVQ